MRPTLSLVARATLVLASLTMAPTVAVAAGAAQAPGSVVAVNAPRRPTASLRSAGASATPARASTGSRSTTEPATLVQPRPSAALTAKLQTDVKLAKSAVRSYANQLQKAPTTDPQAVKGLQNKYLKAVLSYDRAQTKLTKAGLEPFHEPHYATPPSSQEIALARTWWVAKKEIPLAKETYDKAVSRVTGWGVRPTPQQLHDVKTAHANLQAAKANVKTIRKQAAKDVPIH